jgi:hypothetical protein
MIKKSTVYGAGWYGPTLKNKFIVSVAYMDRHKKINLLFQFLRLFCRVVDVKADSTLKLISTRKFDSIWMIVDRLTKYAHLIPVHTKYQVQKYTEIYIACVLCLHGVPETIISDRGSQFVARFWEQLYASLGTHLIHSLTYHLQTGGQTESKSNFRRYAQIVRDKISR